MLPFWLALLLVGCSRSADPSVLSGTLPRLDGGTSVALQSCPTPRCLTVYVAPWCGICRASTGLIQALREHLQARGIATRVVVGKDREAAVRDYARLFGPGTLLDPEGKVPLRGGVPEFISTDDKGHVLQIMPGVPEVYSPPYSEALLRQFDLYLKLD